MALLLAIWWTAALFVGGAKLPSPPAVLNVIIAEASSGALFLHLGATLARRRAVLRGWRCRSAAPSAI